MIKTKTIYRYFFAFSLIILLTVSACDQKTLYPTIVAPVMSEFLVNSNPVTLAFDNMDSPSYTIPVALIAKSSKDVTIGLSITSPTGAENGKQFILSKTDVVMSSGELLDSFKINFDTSYYSQGRIDTIVLTIKSQDGVSPIPESSVVTIIAQKNCTYVSSDFAGTYNIVTDDWADFSQNNLSTVKISVIDDSTFSFPSPLNRAPVLLHLNPKTYEISVNSENYGDYNDGNGSLTVVSQGGVAKNYLSVCDKTIFLDLDYVSTSTGFDYGEVYGGPWVLIFSKQ